jgi:MFS superfamily sulfate permease-like transporter
VSALTIGLLVILERFLPRVPAPLIAVGAGIAAMAWLGLDGLVSPDLSLVAELWPAAMGIALVSFTETVAAGRAFAASGEPVLRANQELFATGAATAAGALQGAMSAGGGTSQTAVNRLAGARSHLAGLVTAAATLLTMLFLAPLMSQMLQATLAAVVIVYSVGLIQPGEFRSILAVRRTEYVWALAAFIGVIALGTLKDILVAIVVWLVALAQQVANPPVHVRGSASAESPLGWSA